MSDLRQIAVDAAARALSDETHEPEGRPCDECVRAAEVAVDAADRALRDVANPSPRQQVEELTAEIDRLTLLVESHVRRALMIHHGWVLLTDDEWVKGPHRAPAGPLDRDAVMAVCDAHIDVTAGRRPLQTEVPSEAS